MTLRLTKHAVEGMADAGLRIADVEVTIADGEVIQRYPEDRPYPSQLSIAWRDGRPVHVVWAMVPGTDVVVVVITVYEPHPDLWDAAFRERRKR